MNQRNVYGPVLFVGCLTVAACLAVVPSSFAQPTGAEEFQEAMEAGQQHMEAGNFDAAVSAFTVAIQRNNFSPDGYAARGQAFAMMEDLDAALKDYKEALDKNPNFLPALVGRAEIYLDAGAVELALPDFELAVEQDRSNLRAVFGLGKAQILLGGARQGVRTLSRVIDANDQLAEAYRLRAQGNASLGNFEDALADVEHALALDPNDFEAFFVKGSIHFQSKQYDDAVTAFDRAIQSYVPDESGLPFSQGYLTKAATHLEIGKTSDDESVKAEAYAASIADVDTLLELLPEDLSGAAARSAALFSKGVAQRLQGDLGAAIESFSEAVKINPEFGEAYFRRGICFHYLNEDALAILDFQHAANINFDDPRARLWEGFCHANLGDLHEAIRTYGLALAKSDRYVPAYVNRGLTYLKLGEHKKAADDFNEAIRLDPTEAEHYFKRGHAHLLLGDRDKATNSFASAIQFDENHSGALQHLANEMDRQGRGDLAAEYRRKAQSAE